MRAVGDNAIGVDEEFFLAVGRESRSQAGRGCLVLFISAGDSNAKPLQWIERGIFERQGKNTSAEGDIILYVGIDGCAVKIGQSVKNTDSITEDTAGNIAVQFGSNAA